jgi:uncharacterized membrane protein
MADYNRVAGQSHERLAALSDGIFAVAMTLLVLGVTVPASATVQHGDERALWSALVALGPRLLTYFMSFLTLGIFWVAQQAQLSHLSRSDRHLTWINLAFLLGVSLIPFSTGFLAEFITFKVAIGVYWANLLLLGMTLFASLEYALRARLMQVDVVDHVYAANRRRIVVFQVLYACAAALCIVNTYLSIALIILLQLLSAVAPRIGPLSRF